jgi:prevent-host-death family protein
MDPDPPVYGSPLPTSKRLRPLFDRRPQMRMSQLAERVILTRLSRAAIGVEMDAHWQVQEAKQRFSELIRRAQTDGVQYVTKHGTEVAVVLDIDEYHRLTGRSMDFKEFLMSIPKGDDLDIDRPKDYLRDVDLSDN